VKKSILEYLERILEAALSALASLGMFLFVTFLINLFWDGTLTTKDMLAVFVASLFVVYCMTHALVMVRYERLEILADELENQEAKELYEHLEVK
jgi:hypothetical protein